MVEKTNKYIEKIINAIESCETLEQLDVAANYVQLAESSLTEGEFSAATIALKRKAEEL